MASYPNSIYEPREKENRAGVSYDPTKKTVIFAEDIKKLDDEVVAIETEIIGKIKYINNLERLIQQGRTIGFIEAIGQKFSDLGQQGGQSHILSLAYLGNGIALAGTYPDGKILRSTDYGVNWSDLGQQSGETHMYSLAYLGNGIALAGTLPNGKILRSTDYGANWSDLGTQFWQEQIRSLAYLGNGIVLAGAAFDGKILRSS